MVDKYPEDLRKCVIMEAARSIAYPESFKKTFQKPAKTNAFIQIGTTYI